MKVARISCHQYPLRNAVAILVHLRGKENRIPVAATRFGNGQWMRMQRVMFLCTKQGREMEWIAVISQDVDIHSQGHEGQRARVLDSHV